MQRSLRRVVTGFTPAGRSTIVADGPVPSVFDFGGHGLDEHWAIDQLPPPLDELVNPIDRRDFALEPPPGGVICRMFFMEPGLGDEQIAMHTTDTLDFLVVVSGEITLLMEEGEVTLGPGDSVIQRGTNHSWANRGSEPCLLADVMISTLR